MKNSPHHPFGQGAWGSGFVLLAAAALLVLVGPGTAAAFPATEVGSIAVTSGPYGIGGNSVYAVVAEGLSGYLDIINLSDNTIPSTQHILVGTNPSMVAVTAAQNYAYVTDYGNNSVYEVSLNSASGFTRTTLSGFNGPVGITIANNIVFVTNYKDNTWSYFTVGSTSSSSSVQAGGGPISIAANSTASLVYVANSTAGTVNVFQANYLGSNTYGVTTTITTGSYPDAVVLASSLSKLYVANGNSNTVSVINTSTNTVGNTITLPSSGHPNGLALTPDGSTLMVINSPAGGITYIQTSTDTVINTLSLGTELEQAYITPPDGAYAYVTDYSANSVYVLASVVSIVSTDPSAINDSNNNVSTITWKSTMSGTYEVEIGGNGTMGSGKAIPGDSGSVTAGQNMTTPIYASDIINLTGGGDGPYTIYIYVQTTGGMTAYASTSILLLTTPPQPVSNVTATPGDSKATVSWTASPSSYIGWYAVYYSTSTFDGSSLPSNVTSTTTSATLTGLSNGTQYYVGVVAYDLAKNPSTLSTPLATVTPVHIPSPSELAGQKGNCFIATAAYGSYDDFDVWVLRKFRDRVLLKSGAGRWFVRTYYRTSPPLAHFIAGHDALRAVVRIMLKPLVYGSMVVLFGTRAQKLLTLFLFVAVFGIAIIGLKQRGKSLFCHSRENGNP